MQTLLLEDDDDARSVFKECIEAAGHNVLECATLDKAINTLRTSKIDLLLLDLVIGNSNSLGVTRFAGYAAPDADIILITGSNRFAKGEIFYSYPGVRWVLRKPLAPTDLEALLEYAEQRYSRRVSDHSPDADPHLDS